MEMKFDYSRLNDRIKNAYTTQGRFAKALGIGRVSLNQRLNNKAQFTQGEILYGSELLKIANEEIPIYFFAKQVQKGEPKTLGGE
jgi:hypothetical protein